MKMYESNDDYDFYSPKKSKEQQAEPPRSTWIGGNEFYKGERFTINGFLFELINDNKLLYAGMPENAPKGLRNTVFDITGDNYHKFFAWTGLSEDKIKKCIPNDKHVDPQKVYEHINRLDLEFEPDGI